MFSFSASIYAATFASIKELDFHIHLLSQSSSLPDLLLPSPLLHSWASLLLCVCSDALSRAIWNLPSPCLALMPHTHLAGFPVHSVCTGRSFGQSLLYTLLFNHVQPSLYPTQWLEATCNLFPCKICYLWRWALPSHCQDQIQIPFLHPLAHMLNYLALLNDFFG